MQNKQHVYRIPRSCKTMHPSGGESTRRWETYFVDDDGQAREKERKKRDRNDPLTRAAPHRTFLTFVPRLHSDLDTAAFIKRADKSSYERETRETVTQGIDVEGRR